MSTSPSLYYLRRPMVASGFKHSLQVAGVGFSVMLAIMLDALATPACGVVGAMLWNWFIVPYGMHPVAPAAAVGIACLFGTVRTVLVGGSWMSIEGAITALLRIGIYFAIGFEAHQYLLGRRLY